jgi:fatty-acyl-CoA synthase
VSTPPRRLFDLLRGGGDPAGPAFAFAGPGEAESRHDRGPLFAAAERLGERVDAALDGAPRDAVVAILAARQEDQVLHHLAVLAAGRVPALLAPPNRKLDRDYFLETTARVLERVRPALLLTDAAGALTALGDRPPCPIAPLGGEAPIIAGTATPRRTGTDTALVQFSSGTTGIKKGVALAFEAVRDQIAAYGGAIGLRGRSAWEDREGDCVASWLPLYHDMGFLTALHIPLAYGVPVTMVDPLDWVAQPARWPHAVHRHGATLGWHPNFAFAFMASRIRDEELEGVDLGSLRGLANCAEPVTDAAQRAFAERMAPHGLREGTFWGCYAMAETTFAVTHAAGTDRAGVDGEGPDARGPSRPRVTVGAPLPGVRLSARGPDGAELGEREQGELWVSAPFAARGYLGDPDAGARAFADGWYRTGDLGHRSGDRWYVTGRVKDVLIVAGHNVFPEDVEAIVSSSPGFKPGRAAAFAEFDDATQTERVVVLAEPSGDADAADVVAARKRLVAELGLAGLRLRLVEPGWLVKSSSGKMARGASASKWRAAA